MITIKNGVRYYGEYKINSNLSYDFNKNHLAKIIAVLNQSRQTMVQPVAAHLSVYITGGFDVTTLMPRVKRVLKDVPVAYAYTVEKSQKLHIHLMLVLDVAGYADPDSLFIETVMPAISNLKHVMNNGCVINLRANKDSYYHYLSDEAEFEDSIERYSYYAKTNQKQYVPKTFKKTFNTSRIMNPKYYDLGENKMMQIRKINKTEALKVDDTNTLTNFQVDIKNQKIRGNNIKLCFALDDATANQPMGFYGLSYVSVSSKSGIDFYITVDELFISRQYVNAEWDEPLFMHLSNQVTAALTKIKGNLRDDQDLMIHAVVPESPELEALLSLAVKDACTGLSLTDRLVS